MATTQQPASAQAKPALVRPSDQTIAFAITIVQSKPPELTVAEYIRLLRQHIARGRRENALSTVHRHLDRSAFWRAEYERMRDAVKAAEDQSIDLRREIEALKSKPDPARPSTARPSSPTKKRKKQDEDVIPVPRSPKKARRDVSPARSLARAASELTLDADFHQAGEIGNIMLRSIYQLQLLLRPGHKANTPDLAYHLVRTASAIPQIVHGELEKIAGAETASDDQLKTVLTVARRAIACVFTGFVRLSNRPDGTETQGKVVYAAVHMFKDLVQDIELLSAKEIEKDSKSKENMTIPKKPAEKPKAKTKAAKPQNIKENPILSLYSTFIGNVVDMLDPKNESNRNLFEGFAYCIIDKVGSRLYQVIFGHQRKPSIEEEIQDGAAVHQTEEDDTEAQPREETKEQKQVKLEAPYLIHLLNRTMVAAPTFLGTSTGKALPKSKQGSTAKASKGSLAVSAKECLQRTLVNAIFGKKEVDDEHDLFKECLNMPSQGTSVLTMPKVKEVDVKEWFKDEMWKILGWEILAKEGDW